MLTDEQKAERRSGLGGSDCAAILKKSKFKSPLDVYQSKIDGVDQEENDAMRWGNYHEPNVLAEYTRQTGIALLFPEENFRHPDYPFIRGNIDGISECGKVIVEAKTTRFPDGWGEPGTHQIPPDYLFQGIHYLNLFPLAERVDYPVLIGSSDFRIYRLERNDEWQRKVLAHEVAFWQNHIIPQIPPDPFSQDDADKLYIDPIKGSRISMNDDIQSALFQLKTLREDRKVLEEREELIKQKIKEYMQNNENLLDCFGNVAATWKSQERTQFDKIGFVKSHDGLYNQFVKQVKTRVLLLK